MTQLSIAEVGPEPIDELGQFFTTPALAARMAEWVRPVFDDVTRRSYRLRVLEPSAGRGHIVQAVHTLCPTASIDAVEIDPRWVQHLRMLACCVVYEGDYLARPAPRERYGLTLANPPYSEGDETPHLVKMMDESERIVVLLPVRSLHGVDRFDRVWSRIGREWWIRRKAHLIARPKFRASGGTDEIVVLDLRRVPGPCEIGWWS